MKCVCLFVAQSCLTLSDAMGCSPPGSSVHGISQARILEWVALSFFRVSSRPRDQTQISYIAGRFYHLSLEGNFMKQAGQTLFPFYREGNCGIKMLHNMHTKRPTKQPFPQLHRCRSYDSPCILKIAQESKLSFNLELE